MQVSIITPAYNAAGTIGETIRSVQAQTHPDWELIIVDDGSTDNTINIVLEFCRADKRIKLINGEHRGAGASRNTGLKNTSYDWLLFLDSDDIIVPDHLKLLTSKLISEPDLDVAYCYWIRLSPSGKLVGEETFNKSGDLFEEFARTCAFSIHSCITRRSLVVEAGAFDESLITCEDWDLWQRIARMGAKFGNVPEILAWYRMRADSSSINSFQMLKDTLRVLETGHSRDERIINPKPQYSNGVSREFLQFKKYHSAVWAAGLALGNGKNITELLSLLDDNPCPDLDPMGIAETLYKSTLLPGCRIPSDWLILYPAVQNKLDLLLEILENKSKTRDLKKRTKRILERIILENSEHQCSAEIGTSSSLKINIMQEINDYYPSEESRNFYANIYYDDLFIGNIQLPVIDGMVSSEIIKDRIVESFAWEILQNYHQKYIFPRLEIIKLKDTVLLKRGIPLGEFKTINGIPDWTEVHDTAGWTIFLQEIWGLYNLSVNDFYNIKCAYKPVRKIIAENTILLEITNGLPDLEVKSNKLNVIITLAGNAVGNIVYQGRDFISATEIFVQINSITGLELCKVAIKNAVIGFNDNNLSFSERLKFSYKKNKLSLIKNESKARVIPENITSENKIILGRRFPELFGFSSSRRYMLPSQCMYEISALAKINSEPLIAGNMESIQKIIYDPDVYEITSGDKTEFTALNFSVGDHYDANYFESLFKQEKDPWNYTNSYEKQKYDETLSLIPKGEIKEALEIACAEGIFTQQLAPLVKNLTVSDISITALGRAKERCKVFHNINYLQKDIYKDSIKGKYDLIVCSEVLYYIEKKKLKNVASKIAAALKPGGILIMAHANIIEDEPDKTGFEWDLPFGAKTIGKTFSRVISLDMMEEIRTDLYRVQKFRKLTFPNIIGTRKKLTYHTLPQELPEIVSSQVVWKGVNRNRKTKKQLYSNRVPILMYHRISPSGNENLRRYRVTPEDFDEQLKYLRDNGYHSTSLKKWGDSIYYRKPLEGKPVILTFDDGYSDFYKYAFPILRKYNFGAVVSIVTENVGKTSSWDNNYGEEVPLMGWDEIRNLHAKGIEVSSHSHTHEHLTALSHEEVVKQAAVSREILTRELGANIYTFCYPYGDHDEIVDHLIGSCGYLYGLSCNPGPSEFNDPHLSLSRIEIMGTDTLKNFADKINNYGYI